MARIITAWVSTLCCSAPVQRTVQLAARACTAGPAQLPVCPHWCVLQRSLTADPPVVARTAGGPGISRPAVLCTTQLPAERDFHTYPYIRRPMSIPKKGVLLSTWLEPLHIFYTGRVGLTPIAAFWNESFRMVPNGTMQPYITIHEVTAIERDKVVRVEHSMAY